MPPTASPASDITPYFMLTLAAAVCALATRRIRGTAPYALVLVVAGLILGRVPHLLGQVRLDPHVLFTVFLPPLLFESALNLRAADLKKDAVPIGVLAIGGTVLSTFVVGFAAAPLLGLPLPYALLFGSLLSATDPISVIAVFKQLGASKRLTLLMEAESLFNDGVAVVLFGILLQLAQTNGSNLPGLPAVWGHGVVQFLLVTLGGIGIGSLLGWAALRLTKDFDDHLLEITLTTVVAWGAYLCGEAAHVSGVVAVVTAGLVVGNWGMPVSMSPTSRLAVLSFWEYAAFAVTSVVFLLVGVEVASANLWKSIPTILGAALVVFVGRSISVYGLCGLLQRLFPRKGHLTVPFNYQHVLVWGGLRGALSMALALGLAPQFPHRGTLVAATFGVVLVSLLGQGMTIGPLLRRLHLSGQSRSETEQEHLAAQTIAVSAALQELLKHQTGETFPEWALAGLLAEYRARLSSLDALRAAYAASQNTEGVGGARNGKGEPGAKEVTSASATAGYARTTAQVRLLALASEREALREAEHGNKASREECRSLISTIDEQTAALRDALRQ